MYIKNKFYTEFLRVSVYQNFSRVKSTLKFDSVKISAFISTNNFSIAFPNMSTRINHLGYFL